MATVSRTQAGNYPVSDETRSRVMAAVDSLHYVVNVHAKALSGRVTGPVALVIKDITGPSLAHVAAGVEQEAADRRRLRDAAGSRRLVSRSEVGLLFLQILKASELRVGRGRGDHAVGNALQPRKGHESVVLFR